MEKDGAGEEGEKENDLPAWLFSINSINVPEGLRFCGSVKDYMDALRIFWETTKENADEIEKYFRAKDWDNYTTKIHALKSSARIVGISEFSERARRLEDAGNRRYIGEIEKDTPALLALYRASGSALAPLGAPEKNKEKFPEIELSALFEAYDAIREMAASFDYDTILFILDELSRRRIPKEEEPRYLRIVKAAKKPDWDELKGILAE